MGKKQHLHINWSFVDKSITRLNKELKICFETKFCVQHLVQSIVY